MFKLAADGAGCAGDGEGLLDLTKNLRFADDHRVETGGDAEEMAHSLLIPMLVEMRSKECRVEAEVAVQKCCQFSVGCRRSAD